jgi:hypothetical protein
MKTENVDYFINGVTRGGILRFSVGLYRLLETDIRPLRRYNSIAHEKIQDFYNVGTVGCKKKRELSE